MVHGANALGGKMIKLKSNWLLVVAVTVSGLLVACSGGKDKAAKNLEAKKPAVEAKPAIKPAYRGEWAAKGITFRTLLLVDDLIQIRTNVVEGKHTILVERTCRTTPLDPKDVVTKTVVEELPFTINIDSQGLLVGEVQADAKNSVPMASLDAPFEDSNCEVDISKGDVITVTPVISELEISNANDKSVRHYQLSDQSHNISLVESDI